MRILTDFGKFVFGGVSFMATVWGLIWWLLG